MSRYNTQPRQPVPESRGKPRSGDAVMVMERPTEGPKAHPVLKAFYKDLMDGLRTELGDFFGFVEVNLDKTTQSVSLKILQSIEGLHETIVIQVNRTLKHFQCLVFDAGELHVRLNQTA